MDEQNPPAPPAPTTTEPTATEPRRTGGRRPRAVVKPATPPAAALGADDDDDDLENDARPLRLSADALEGTRDRLTAFEWMEGGENVRRRSDGVYERIVSDSLAADAVPETLEFYPDVDMLERRLLDPNISSDVSILFKDETSLRPGAKPLYYKRWVDTHVPSRVLVLEQRAGYKKAEWPMLADKSTIGDRHEDAKDNIVRRGDKGRYVLMFMPYLKWEGIKRAQAELRTRREQTQMTHLAAGMAAGEKGIGPQGAEQIDRTFRGSIRELPPQSVEAFQSSGLPKDIAAGAAALEAE